MDSTTDQEKPPIEEVNESHDSDGVRNEALETDNGIVQPRITSFSNSSPESTPGARHEFTFRQEQTPQVQIGHAQGIAQKNIMSQGLLDLALITANVTQIRYTTYLYQQSSSSLFVFLVICLSLSIILQIVQACFLLHVGRLSRSIKSDPNMMDRICKHTNFSIVCNIIITVLNIFIASFS
ncbi:ninjurin-B-like [Artemia franciscana]